jgi:kumamolisin
MTSPAYTEVASSRRAPPHGTRTGPVPADEVIEVSLYLKPRADAKTAIAAAHNRRAAIAQHRAANHASDIAQIKAFAAEHGLTVSAIDPARRLVKLAGSAAQIQAAFRTEVSCYHDGTRAFRGRTGALHVPDDIAPLIDAVLGIDTRPAAQPRLVHLTDAAALPGYLPNQVGQFYNFPTDTDGHGQTIALIELGGGFRKKDTTSAFKAMGLKAPTVVSISVDHGLNKPTPDDGADGEVALDIQVAGGVAPGASIAVYFAPNTDAGFVDAITAAVHDTAHTPSVISISWGGAESTWTAQAVTAMNNALKDAELVGVSVFVASGDDLATDSVSDGKAHVDFPASSPWAIGCGGTAITVEGSAITGERVWNDGTSGTGGGVSDLFPLPDFQKSANVPPGLNAGFVGRGVPDVAGDAAPGTGYIIIIGGRQSVVGGTSAVAPLWAGLTALINSKASRPVGFLLPFLYANPHCLRPVTQGDNKPTNSNLGYAAGPGWSACTGLGVPDGAALMKALANPFA